MHWGRKCTALTELLHVGLGDALKGALSSLGGGVNAFFLGVSYWKSVKIRESFLKLRGFQCIGARNVPPPLRCCTLGWAMH